MADSSYSLVFEGKIARGFTTTQVRENFSRLFKVDGERLEQLFSGRSVLLKQNIDRATLTRFTRVLDQAGARYTIDPPLSASEPADHTTIIDCSPQPEDLRFSPQPCPRITGHAGGIDFNRNDIRRVAFDRIRLVSTFVETAGPDEIPLVLFFITGSQRPYWIPADKIAFGDFVSRDGTPSLKQSIQHFIDFLRVTNPRMVLDRPTSEFLKTGASTVLGKSATRYATGLALALGRMQPEAGAVQHRSESPAGFPPASDDPPVETTAGTRQPNVPGMKLAAAQPASAGVGASSHASIPRPHRHGTECPTAQEPAEPVLQIDPLSWTSLFAAAFFAGLHVVVLVGILKAPNIFYDFLVSHIHINGQRLKFNDPWILLRTALYQLPVIPLSIPFFYNVYLIEDVSSGYVVLMPVTLALAALGCSAAAVVFVNSFLTHITYKPGESPFAPLYDGDSPQTIIGYMRENPGEAVRIVLAGFCSCTVLLLPLGIALFVDVLMKRVLVDGYRYRVRIPWGDSVLWCVLSYLSAFLGLFRYIGILYEQVFPSGRWVRDSSAAVAVNADSAGSPQADIQSGIANNPVQSGATASAAVMSAAMQARTPPAPRMSATAPEPAQPRPGAASTAPGAVIVMGGEQSPRRFRKPLAAGAVVIVAVASAVLLLSRLHGPPNGFRDIRFGTSIHDFDNLEKVELDNPIERINAMMNDGGTGNKLADLRCLSYASVNTGLGMSPLFHYDMYYRTDDDLRYADRDLWDIFYGFKNDLLVYVRMYPGNSEDYTAIRKYLQDCYGEAADVTMHHYPTLLSPAWQWDWEDAGVAIRVVAPITKNYDEMDDGMLKAQTEELLKPYEIPEEFRRNFIEFIGDAARVRVDALMGDRD